MSGAAGKKLLLQALANRTLSTVLLIIITAMLIIGSFLPNPAFMLPEEIVAMQVNHPLLFRIGAGYNSQKLATGYLFGFIGIFLILSASFCSIDRMLARLGSGQATGPETIPSGTAPRIFLFPGADLHATGDFVSRWFRRRLFGAQVSHERELGVILVSRGRFGFWGSIVFHTFLITALAGMVIYYLGETRGLLSMTEGERIILEKSSFRYLEKEPVWGLSLPRVQMELLEQHSRYAEDEQHTALEHLARFRVTDPDNGTSSISDVKINHPLRLGGKDFILKTGGYSTRFTLADTSGTVLFNSFVSLREEGGTRDDFSMPGTDLHLQIRFFPDFTGAAGRLRSKSPQLNNPVASVTVRQQGRTIFDGTMPLGGSVRAGGNIISMPEVRRWVELEMSSEPGVGFFFVISFVGIMGIMIRILDPDERITVVLRQERDGVVGEFATSSRHFSALLATMPDECVASVNSCRLNTREGKG